MKESKNKKVYYSYADLEERYSKDRRTIWRWHAKNKVLEPPKKIGNIFIGWTEDQLITFESGITNETI